MNMRTQLIVALVALGAVPLSAPFGSPRLRAAQPVGSSQAGPCAFTDRGNPKALVGSVHQNNYAFTHVSDVDSRSPSHYLYILKNDHLTRLLPAKWVKAGILFDEIAVNGCGRNDFDSTLAFTPDHDAPVDYGPQTQHSAPAEAYVRKTTPQSTRPPTAPKLTSRIFALLAGQRIDFNFTAYITDGIFHYEAQNRGSQDVPFRIPALTTAWSQFQAQRLSQWAPWSGNTPNVFSLDASGPIRELRISSQQATAFAEEIVAVQILSKETLNTVVAAGRVSLYLPASGPGR